MKFKSFPEIKTERLLLRGIEESDWDVILFLRSDKTVNKYIECPENRNTKNKEDAIKFIKDRAEDIENFKSISWGITLKNNPQIIGSICLWNFSNNNKTAEVGYSLNPEYYNKGIMSEVLKEVVEFGFKDLNFEKIEAYTHTDNESSKKILEKNGFRFVVNKKDENNAANRIYEIEKDNN
jgi:ribosomal-protein-alanine N-acetyltransferase